MADVIYDKNEGSQYCTVVTDDGQTARAQLMVVVSGQIIFDKSKTSNYATVITEDGQTVRARIVSAIQQ